MSESGLRGGINPFDVHPDSWFGHYRAIGDVAAGPISEGDVAEVLHEHADRSSYDGTVVAVIRLHDGRFVSWETFWDVTGDGFYCDAYGGDADVFFAASLDDIYRYGLTENGRRLIGVSIPEEAP